MKRNSQIVWYKVDVSRPLEFESIVDCLTHLAAHTPATNIIWEARGSQGRVGYFLGVDKRFAKRVQVVLSTHSGFRFRAMPTTARAEVSVANQMKVSKPIISLNTNIAEAVVRSGLSILAQARGKEQIVLQLILGSPYAPTPVPTGLKNPHASWMQVALGNVDPATADGRNAVKDKIGCHGFGVCVRVGATGSAGVARSRILSLLSAIRTLTSAGINISTVSESPGKLDAAYIPYRYKLRLSVKEAAILMMLPIGETELPGVAGLHPKELPVPEWYTPTPPRGQDRTFALTSDGQARLSIAPEDSKEHCIIIGPTGSGKSTAMQRMILSDIYAGRSVLVIDPKADLVNNILARIPEHRVDDVVVIDPSAEKPVGFNPLAFKDTYNPGLVADAILAVFQEVFKENWGIRSQDHISAALLTLVRAKGSSLLWLPQLLTDEVFRKKVTAGIDDKIGLEAYWAGFENLRDSERRQEIAPVLNKVRQFLLRPGLRNVLGQSDPKFNLTDLFTKPRIVLVPLNKGLIGAESAKLLGSLIVGLTWTLALSRADLPEALRKLVSVYIDELQDYLALPTSLADALAQARGLGVGLTLAHQYREQMPPNIRAGIDTNCRNKIVFGLSSSDAKDMAAMAPELKPEDFMALPRFHVYASINQKGQNTGWVSGKTLPMSDSLRNPTVLKAKSSARYGKSGKEVEQEYLEMLAECKRVEVDIEADVTPVGRKVKT